MLDKLFSLKRFSQFPGKSLRTLHFLHIGKNAGSQISTLAKQVNELSTTCEIKRCPHRVGLIDLKNRDEYFFSIRDPITRFRSAFYSRQRKGQPRYYFEWTKYEAPAFECFEHANELAEALFEPGEMGLQAFAAIKSIQHTSDNQARWFNKRGTFLTVHPPVWIIRQENFEADLKNFFRKADLDVGFDDVAMPSGEARVHAGNYADVPALSDTAKEKLRRWYAQDFELYRMCEDWLNRQSV